MQVRCNLTTSAVQAFAKKRYPMPDPQIDEPEKEAEFSVAPPMSNNLENEKIDIEKEE